MTQKLNPKLAAQQRRRLREEMSGFDVTVRTSIGRVKFGEGEDTAHVAAFKLIAENGEPGTYEFPDENGGNVVVTVQRQVGIEDLTAA